MKLNIILVLHGLVLLVFGIPAYACGYLYQIIADAFVSGREQYDTITSKLLAWDDALETTNTTNTP